jgi:hypothetical protein
MISSAVGSPNAAPKINRAESSAPFFLFMHGKDITIPKGTEITAYTDGEIKLDRQNSQRTELSGPVRALFSLLFPYRLTLLFARGHGLLGPLPTLLGRHCFERTLPADLAELPHAFRQGPLSRESVCD